MNATDGESRPPATGATPACGSPDREPASRAGWLRRPAVICGLLLAVVLAVTFLLPAGVTLGAPDTDLIGQFVAWRAFAAESMRAGDFPLWNPYVYAGQPFLGGFQSALLYPPNLVFLALPLERALTFSMALHLAILGGGVGWWARQRGNHPAAAAAAGFAFALSGVVFPHVYAGHLSNLCTMAWAPWMFAGLERWSADRRPTGLALAGAAIALQILGGQVQYVFFLAVAAGLWALVATVREPAARPWALPGVAIAGLVAAALAAAQLLPGWEAAQEGVRQGRLEYGFASSFALPPENLLTALVPGFFGDVARHPYWGRCYSWEMSVHAGVLILAAAAMAGWGRDTDRRARADLLVAGLLIVLALGRHLPVYSLLYAYVPGFGQFRGMSKFTFPALLFVTMAGAAGLDRLWRGRCRLPRVAAGLFVLGAGLGVVALLLWAQPGLVRRVFDWILTDTHPDMLIAPPKFPAGAPAQAVAAFARAAGICLLAAGLIRAGVTRPIWRWLAVGLLPLEMIMFAHGQFATTPISVAMPSELREFVAKNPGDYRVLNLARPNNGFLLGAPDVWGNDPGVLKRYAEFMTFTQGGNPDQATQNVAFTQIPPIYAMLRCRYAFVPSATGVNVVDVPNPLPRAVLVSDYRVAAGRDETLKLIMDPSFDPRRAVVLETEPAPRPVASAPSGTVKVTSFSADSLTIEAEVASPALLLLTELHSRGWRTRALAGSTQPTYEILRANYILQAVPLAAGRHRLTLEYRPRTFSLGLGISALAWLGLAAAFGWTRRASRPAAGM